jgi:hypothetical protein
MVGTAFFEKSNIQGGGLELLPTKHLKKLYKRQFQKNAYASVNYI